MIIRVCVFASVVEVAGLILICVAEGLKPELCLPFNQIHLIFLVDVFFSSCIFNQLCRIFSSFQLSFGVAEWSMMEISQKENMKHWLIGFIYLSCLLNKYGVNVVTVIQLKLMPSARVTGRKSFIAAFFDKSSQLFHSIIGFGSTESKIAFPSPDRYGVECRKLIAGVFFADIFSQLSATWLACSYSLQLWAKWAM